MLDITSSPQMRAEHFTRALGRMVCFVPNSIVYSFPVLGYKCGYGELHLPHGDSYFGCVLLRSMCLQNERLTCDVLVLGAGGIT